MNALLFNENGSDENRPNSFVSQLFRYIVLCSIGLGLAGFTDLAFSAYQYTLYW